MSGQFDTFNIGGNGATPLWNAGDGPCLFQNLDTANTVYLGTDSGVDGATGSGAIPLEPGGNITLDGSFNTYAKCLIGLTAEVAVIPGGIGFNSSPSVQLEQIINSGIPLLANPVQIYNSPPTTLPGFGAGVVMTPVNPVTVNGVAGAFCGYLSYDIVISLSIANNNETSPFATVRLDFYENPADTAPVDSVQWTIAGAFTTGHITNGKGPLRGQYVVATMTAISASGFNQTVNTFRLLGTSRTVTRDDWRDQNQPILTTLSGRQMTGNAQSNNLGINALLVVNASGGNNLKFTNLFAGDVYFFCNVTGLTTNQLHVQISAIDGTAANIVDQFIGAATNSQIAEKLTLGRSIYSVSYVNNASVAATIQGSLTALEP